MRLESRDRVTLLVRHDYVYEYEAGVDTNSRPRNLWCTLLGERS